MFSATKSLRRAQSSSRALPRVDALRDLYARGVEFRESQLWMLTGRPGASKTFFSQWLVNEMAAKAKALGNECPGIYFFLDGTPYTAAVRQAAWVTGHRTQDISEALKGEGVTFYEEALAETSADITFVYDKKPELPEISEVIDAYVELWDRYPSWMIFDNLRNLGGADEGHEAKKFVLSELQMLAYKTGSCIGVLHHATESGVRDYSKPPKVNETEDKVSQYPEMVISVAKDPNSDKLNIAVAKLRDGGESDPSAEHPVTLFTDLSRVRFTNMKPAEPAWSPSGWGDGEDY